MGGKAAVQTFRSRTYAAFQRAEALFVRRGPLALGYFLGDMLSRLGIIASRILILIAVVWVTLVLLWRFVLRVRGSMPFVVSILASVRDVTCPPETGPFEAGVFRCVFLAGMGVDSDEGQQIHGRARQAFIIKQSDEGTLVAEIRCKAGISQATYFNGKKKYAGLLPTESWH